MSKTPDQSPRICADPIGRHAGAGKKMELAPTDTRRDRYGNRICLECFARLDRPPGQQALRLWAY